MKYAFVATVFKNKNYIKGATTLAKSLKMYLKDNSIDVVCMITEDLNIYKPILEKQFDRVIIVPYLRFDTQPFKSEKQKKMYGSWIDVSYTKWNCLKLTEYDKIVYLDSNQIINDDITDLFELQTPAALFSMENKMPNTIIRLQDSSKFHGKVLSNQFILDRLNNIIVRENNRLITTMCSACCVLTPSLEDFNGLIKMIESNLPFGNKKYINGVDEVSLFEYYLHIKKSDFVHISNNYAYIQWHKQESNQKVKIYNFFGEKPWDLDRNVWPDFEIWYKYADQVSNDWKNL